MSLLDLVEDVWSSIIKYLTKKDIFNLLETCNPLFNITNNVITIHLKWEQDYVKLLFRDGYSCKKLGTWSKFKKDPYYNHSRLKIIAHKMYHLRLNKDKIDQLYKVGIFNQKWYEKKLYTLL